MVDLHLRSPGNQVFAFGAETVLHPVIEIVNVGLRIEAGEGAKSVAAVGVVEQVIQFASIALQRDLRGRAGKIGPESAGVIANVATKCGTYHSLKTGNPVGIEFEAAVDSTHPVEVWTHFAIGKHHAQGRLASDIAAD